MKVTRSGYYAWLKNSTSAISQHKSKIKTEILSIYAKSKKRYGAPKIADALNKKGIKIAVRTVSKYMKELGIRSIIIKKFKPNKSAKKNLPYENLLNQNFNTDQPNKAWVTDITYIWTRKHKWVYLASVMDLFSRKIIGYEISRKMDVSLVRAALLKAAAGRGSTNGIIHHSDRGSQYTSNEYLNLLKDMGFKISLSGKGNCYDNACIEAFHSILKREFIYIENFETIEDLKLGLFSYIEGFYNRNRSHGKLGYLSPEIFENLYFESRLRVA